MDFAFQLIDQTQGCSFDNFPLPKFFYPVFGNFPASFFTPSTSQDLVSLEQKLTQTRINVSLLKGTQNSILDEYA